MLTLLSPNRAVTKMLFLHRVALLAGVMALLFGMSTRSARADVWAFVDERGVAHFASEPVDERYELFARGDALADASLVSPSLASSGASTPPASRVLIFFDIFTPYKAVKHYVRAAASAHDIDHELLQALIATESGFDAQAVSPRGAVGLMQLMPATAARFGVRGDRRSPVASKLTDPALNIKTGARYLRYLLNRFPGRLELALAAYNAGEGAVRRAGNQVPNYKETQNYVKTVMALYGILKPPVVAHASKLPGTKVPLAFPADPESPGQATTLSSSIAPISSSYSETD